jgi:hypothetical protein
MNESSASGTDSNIIGRDDMAQSAQKALGTLLKRLDQEGETMPIAELADVTLTLVKIDEISLRQAQVQQAMTMMGAMIAGIQGASGAPADRPGAEAAPQTGEAPPPGADVPPN